MTPSFTIVQDMLVRADLPMDVIALAVCILDSLTWKFSRSWRASFPLTPTTTNSNSNTTADERLEQQPNPPPRHIDSVFPEVIILGALVIASKFTEDVQESMRYFGTVWGQNMWSCEQINFTERCIMESLGYHIMPLWSASHIKQARHDIEMARRELFDEDINGADAQQPSSREGGNGSAKHHSKSKSAGHAMTGTAGLGLGRGLQLTPAETPTSEAAESPFEHHGLRRQGRSQTTRNLGQETRDAFSKPMDMGLPGDYLHLPGEVTPR